MSDNDAAILSTAISSGLLWGAIVAGIYRWAGRDHPDKVALQSRSIKVFFIVATIIAAGYFAMQSGY